MFTAMKLRLCRSFGVFHCLTQGYSLLTGTSQRRVLQTIEPAGIMNSFFSMNPSVCYSIKSSSPSIDDIHLNKRIISIRKVDEQLELFDSVKHAIDIVNKVTILYCIAKIIGKDEKQKLVLQKEREKAREGQNSRYVELLENISKDISECKSKGLVNVMWSLGKIEEKNHKLVQFCEKEILSRDILALNNAGICQIVSGCANLELTASHIFRHLEEAILNGHLEISTFDNQLLSAILLSFAKAENGSLGLFRVFLEEILSRDFLKIDNHALAEFVWSFAKRGFKADRLFRRVEGEIIRRGTHEFNNGSFIQILWAFSKAGKGSKHFFTFLDDQLLSRGVNKFLNVHLLEIVWSFAKRKLTKAKVFELVKKEVLKRSVHKFQSHELLLILWSFVSARRHDNQLVAHIERELCSRKITDVTNGDLSQVAWSLGRAHKSDSELFDIIEREAFNRGVREFTMKEKRMLMRGFIEAKRGSKEFYRLLVSSFSASDFNNLHGGQLCECVWCFSRAGVESDTQLQALEKEILIKGRDFFSQKQAAFLNKSFKKLGRGNQDLFK